MYRENPWVCPLHGGHLFHYKERVGTHQSNSKQANQENLAAMSWHWRQFACPDCPPAKDHYDIKRWHIRVPDHDPSSKCRSCKKKYTAIPIGQEVGVGVCNFECSECNHEYTVVCEMTDTAKCYQCSNFNTPVEFSPLRRINAKSRSNKHSCSKCNGDGHCPNMERLR